MIDINCDSVCFPAYGLLLRYTPESLQPYIGQVVMKMNE